MEQEVEELLEGASENKGLRKELRRRFFDRLRAESETGRPLKRVPYLSSNLLRDKRLKPN